MSEKRGDDPVTTPTASGIESRDMSLLARTYIDDRIEHRPLSLPIDRATTFQASTADEHRRLYAEGDNAFYQRFGHPTAAFVAERIAELEGAEAGLLFSSGMGAVSSSLFACLSPGDHIVSHSHIFAQTRALIEGPLSRFGITSTFVDAREVSNVERAILPSTRVVYLETPSNPWLHIQDLQAISAVLPSGVEMLVDSTFASPVLQKPLQFGATLVLHSATKYLGGHSDVMGGVACGRADLIRRVREWQILLGAVADPGAAWLLFRGMRTLGIRMERQASTAFAVAVSLQGHESVDKVHYPWLTGADNTAARRQMRAGGAMVSFEIRGGSVIARRFLDALRRIPIATSLGGVETVIELPFDLDFDEDTSIPERRIDDGASLVRLSVGLEPPDEIVADLRQALAAASGPV